MATRFLNNIKVNDAYTLPSNDGTDGQAIITDGNGNLSFGAVAAASAENAEAVHLEVKNTSGATINKGTPVYITGNVGNTNKLEIAPADASDAAKMPAVGLLETTLSDNAEGYVAQGGYLKALATATIDGTSASSNDTVYVKAGGGLTLTKPTGTNYIQNVAKVARVDSSNGSLVVSSILRTNDVPTPLHIDHANQRLGIGTTTPGYKLEVDGSAAVDSLTINGTGVTATATEINVLDGIPATLTATELGYVDGVTSAIQTQLNAKQATVSGAASTIVSANLTPSRVIQSSGSGKVVASNVTSTELSFLDGVTSSIQTQLNNKVSNVTTNLGITGTTGARTITSSDGADAVIPVATDSVSGVMSAADHTKLSGIATNATANTGTVDTSGTPVDNDFARFTDANTIEGRSASETRSDLGLGSLATLSSVNASTITDNSVGAAELNVSGNGSTSQFLRSDGDGTFTWATPTNTNTNQLTTFQVEDGDGTEVTISHGKEWKFREGQGIDVNWTDTSSGTDGDPYDLTFALKTNGVRANELNVSGNGTSSQFLRSDGDGSFTWATPTKIEENSTITFGQGSLQWTDISGNGGTGLNGGTPQNPFDDWHHHIIMNHANSSGYYVDIAASFHNDRLHFRRKAGSTLQNWQEIFHDAYHPNADKWTTARTITLGGDLSGSVSIDGSANVTLTAAVANDSHTHDGRYYTESEMQTFFNRGYINAQSASNLAVGWYTIATNTGDRAMGEFQIWDVASGDHQSVLFNASHHFGTDSSNDITVLANSRHGATNFRYIRIKENSTYDGAALQVYIDGSTNAVYAAITGANAQSAGWVLKDWIPDATDPGAVDNWSSFTAKVTVDLDEILSGGMLTSGSLIAQAGIVSIDGTNVVSEYSSTNYARLESNSSGGVIKGSGGNGFLARSYGDSYFNGGNFGIKTTSPAVSLDINATDAIALPTGTTAQRPSSPAAGMFRYNTDDDQFEGYTTEWGAIAGSGGGEVGTLVLKEYVGDGSTSTYALDTTPASEAYVDAYIDGVYQEKATYSVSGSNIVFDSNIPNGSSLELKTVGSIAESSITQTTFVTDEFTADGSTSNFTLVNGSPTSKSLTMVFIQGVYQFKSNYNLVSGEIQFTAIPDEDDVIEVISMSAVNTASSPVTSVNGEVGAVSITSDVTSVNGSTGAVVLDAEDIPGVVDTSDDTTGLTFWTGTQAEYDALSSYDSTKLYFIT